MAVRRQERRGTRAAWTAANPVLAAGEIGVELADALSLTDRVKVGDGTRAWNSLGYIAGGDTGWCVLSEFVSGESIGVEIRRTNDKVRLRVNPGYLAGDAADFADVRFPALPTGFRGSDTPQTFLLVGDDTSTNTGAVIVTDSTIITRGADGEPKSGNAEGEITTSDAWPTSLPS